MRITNKMMTNNMMSNINKNKVNLSKLDEQYSTGKKIQRPSDDPIITVRALKLRTNLSELEQYFGKNIPDAKSWMDVTESALRTVNSILKQVNTYCVQGSTDTLTATDRSSIVENLRQLKDQIYHEGNTNYAGRYVFTGYKTDSSLIFTEDTSNLSYQITENISGKGIQVINKVTGSYELSDFDNNATEDFSESPIMNDVYRLQLSYENLSDADLENIRIFKKNAAGQLEEQTPFDKIKTISVTEEDAYIPASDEAHFIPETGEIILGSGAYEELRTADNMKITYSKTGFNNGDLKPEHYFDCVMTDNNKPEQEPITYTRTSQDIEYEVNYNQKLKVNTEGADAITHQIGRAIDDILKTVNDVIKTEEKIKEVEKRLQDTTLSEDDVKRYNKLKEQLDTELELKKEAMQQAFSKGITSSSVEQDRVNTAVADLGSRYVRLELTENRLSNQKVDFEELLSENEDADLTETIIKFNAAATLYNASLSAASKVVQNSLLDFL
jgi:flagellar hook-associated protein 3 FlgL